MSLINKMLQDLDARAGKPGAQGMPSDIRPVLPPERGLPWKRVAVAAGATAALAVAGVVGWRMLGQKPAPAPAVAAAPKPAPVLPKAPEPTQALAFEIPVPPREDLGAPLAEEKPVDKAAPVKKAPAKVAPKPAANKEEPKVAPVKTGGRVEAAPQRAENAYRRALASLEDGRVTEAIAGLEAALKADPRHEASRQTLVSLLIEAGRPEEAMRQLGAALALDARQPAMAMLMARLQLERGSPAVDTLMRTLPYAAGNGEYHAFLAGVLQQEQRHREAAEHYQAALRTAPGNGVWWMGLGISLQAEKRNPEAAGAYQKALASGTLSSELQAFVERRLKQLGR